jgi:hypothetical protein
MKRLLVGALALAIGSVPAAAQSLDDLNIQIHGYATQGFVYTSQNNVFGMNSSSGSPAWTEAVVNITSQPTPKLRVGVQGRYFVMGTFGNSITLDWASADYKVDDRFGVRFGKVKTPMGLLNETQDIDPSYNWALLPQTVYAILSRNTFLAHLGGVVYGRAKVPNTKVKIDWRLFGGQVIESASDPNILLGQQASGINLPNGWAGPMWGGTLNIRPTANFMFGASDQAFVTTWTAVATASNGSLQGTNGTPASSNYYYFAKYEKDKFMLAGEYFRQPYSYWYLFPTAPALNSTGRLDQRSWYAMTSYKVTPKLVLGAYNTQAFDHQQSYGPARYTKDWTISGRYDFSQFIYAKAEQHFVNGEFVNYAAANNPNGLKPSTKMTILKVGVSF